MVAPRGTQSRDYHVLGASGQILPHEMSHRQVLGRRAWEINYNIAQGNVNLPDTRATDQSEASPGLWPSVPPRPRVTGLGDVIQERGKRGKEPGVKSGVSRLNREQF